MLPNRAHQDLVNDLKLLPFLHKKDERTVRFFFPLHNFFANSFCTRLIFLVKTVFSFLTYHNLQICLVYHNLQICVSHFLIEIFTYIYLTIQRPEFHACPSKS